MNPQTGARTSGGLTAPVPISPALLTPKSWHHQPTNPTSVSGGAGQLTHVTRGGRGWLVAGVASLCILTGAGGYIASRVMNASDKPAAAAAEPEAPPPVPVAPPAAVVAPDAPVAPVEGHTADVTAPVAPAAIEKTIPDPEPPEPVVAKVVDKPKPKPAATKPKPTVVATPKPPKPTKPKPKPDAGDLFDSRK
jgi:hypothetical protein